MTLFHFISFPQIFFPSTPRSKVALLRNILPVFFQNSSFFILPFERIKFMRFRQIYFFHILFHSSRASFCVRGGEGEPKKKLLFACWTHSEWFRKETNVPAIFKLIQPECNSQNEIWWWKVAKIILKIDSISAGLPFVWNAQLEKNRNYFIANIANISNIQSLSLSIIQRMFFGSFHWTNVNVEMKIRPRWMMISLWMTPMR